MTWADFYLICFVFGFAFSLLSFLAGGVRWHLPFHIHLHTPTPHVHVGHAPAGKAVPHHGHVSPWNLLTLSVFLAWFGGAGLLLTRFSTMWAVTSLATAALAGLCGGAIVFMFLRKVAGAEDESLDPADFEMAGVLGRTSVPIREGGTGEIIYSQAGTRRTCGARAEDGTAVPKGTEVMVTRYEKGIAYVRLWSEMAGEDDSAEPGKAGQR